MDHPLHIKVAEELEKKLKGRITLLRDPACGGTQLLSLFVGAKKGRDTRMCNVDLLIVSDGEVKVIIEVEESGFLPTKICGKFLQSAIATYFINESQRGQMIPYSSRVLFVQVLDGSKCLKQGTRKDTQGELIERKIRELLPLKGSSISDYHLFFVQGVNDHAGLESVGAAVDKALT
jgi:hypothetical protein